MKWIAVASLSAVLLVAGCGERPDRPSETSPRPEASVASEQPEDLTVAPTPAPSGPTSRPSSGAPGAPISLTGVVTMGVEAGCLLLDGYLLIGGDKAVLRAGARVSVTGRVDLDVVTTCQQGTPLLVATAEPA